MRIALGCAKCGARMEFEVADAGRSAKCPACREEIQIPLRLKPCAGCRRQVARELVTCPACGSDLTLGSPAETKGGWGRVFEPPAEPGAAISKPPGTQSFEPNCLPPNKNSYSTLGELAEVDGGVGGGTSGKAIWSLVLGLISLCILIACFTGVPAIVLGLFAHNDIRRAAGRLKGHGIATAGILGGAIGLVFIPILLVLFLPAVQMAREAARRSQCQYNLTQIGLAFESYHDTWGSFPPAFSTDATGRPLLSWRVLILPHVNESQLYAEFNLDEPWDSSHNLGVASTMPELFRCPADPISFSSLTSYVAIAGPGTAFPRDRAVKISDITDSLAETTIVGEVKAGSIVWTQPEDFVPDTVLVGTNRLGSHHADGWHMLMSDGTPRFISNTIDRILLRALMTIQGGELLDADSF